jgi:conjugal transfer/entry exclusion protein
MAQIQNFLNLRRRLIRRNFIMNRALVYSSLVLMVTIGYALMVSGFGMVFYQVANNSNNIYPFFRDL